MTPEAAVVLAVLTAAGLEWTVIEPPQRIHPVALLGQGLAYCNRDWSAPLIAGIVVAVGVPVGVGAIAWGGITVMTRYSIFAAGIATGAVLFVTTSLRLLLLEAGRVITDTEFDVEAARERVPALVGRAPASLSAGELRSAAVESAAENLADGLVAPLLAFLLGATVSLPLGAAAAVWVKAVNTLDSMFGYPDRSFGTAAAKLDDVVMWLPARISAVLIAIAAGTPTAIFSARTAASRPASPNAGWPMGTMAVVLDTQLRKPNQYTLNKAGALPTVPEARRGIRLIGYAGGLAYLGAILAGLILWV